MLSETPTIFRSLTSRLCLFASCLSLESALPKDFTMAFELSPLPYNHDALEPYIDRLMQLPLRYHQPRQQFKCGGRKHLTCNQKSQELISDL